ncbi:MAG: hypothetical protein H0X29_04235 [Parachlamydiaceae bacterium]|nr:hypothetical protein [Parachlamydiaceae bacterium]
MQAMDSHERISYWADFKDRDDLITRVLGEQSDSVVQDNNLGMRMKQIIQRYLNVHKDQFYEPDLPTLNKLEKEIKLQSDSLSLALSETFITTHTAIKNKSNFFKKPAEIYNLISEYLSLEDIMNLCVLGQEPSPAVTTQVLAKSTDEDIDFFVKNLFLKSESDPDTSTAMFRAFFKLAPDQIQKKFITFYELQQKKVPS